MNQHSHHNAIFGCRTMLNHARHALRLAVLLPLLALASLHGNGNDFPAAQKNVTSSTISVGRESIQIEFAPGRMDLSRAQITDWVQTAAQAVTIYYGRFPIAGAHVLVVPRSDERGVLQGTTWGDMRGHPAVTRMVLGEHTTTADLNQDWTMTHEFVHLALPALADEHHWLEEGLATYVEPVARVQAGFLPASRIWTDMVRDMPKGEPASDGQGLDRTHTWASTYWGGALFCLRADIAIREQTGNRLGLQDALRGILDAGGNISQEWPIDRVLRTGDTATGTTVLSDLYRKMAEEPDPMNLPALWRQLGIRVNRQPVLFEADAPLAPIRVAITQRPKH